MIQTPPPAQIPGVPFDWNMFWSNDLTPLIATVIVAVGVVLVLRVIMKSPVGDAWAERIRRKTHLKYGEASGLSGEQAAIQVEAVHDQMGRIEAHLAEINERLDFTERVLTKKDPNAIGPAR